MVERITDPHRPVRLPHGVGRIPDGRTVPQPPRPRPVTRRDRLVAALASAVVVAGVVIGSLRDLADR